MHTFRPWQKRHTKCQNEPFTTVWCISSDHDKTPTRFPIDPSITVGEVATTRYLLSEGWITELRKAECYVPSLFFETGTMIKYSKLESPKHKACTVKFSADIFIFVFLFWTKNRRKFPRNIKAYLLVNRSLTAQSTLFFEPASLPKHTFPGQAKSSRRFTITCAHFFCPYWTLEVIISVVVLPNYSGKSYLDCSLQVNMSVPCWQLIDVRYMWYCSRLYREANVHVSKNGDSH